MIDWERFYNAFRKPDFIPGYEVQNHLGGGAFGEVYKARKTSIGKAYAIKFLRLDDASQKDATERELEQVRLFAAIDHPNLVTIEDMGVVLGVPFLVMGYAGEDTLARRIARRELEREAALRFFVQAARGVLALHDRRLAHFDLKPSNIFLNGDVARVGDYGLAKLLTEGRATLSFGRGTPHYMAPEMLRNRADHRADLYSLGVILYESLAFELPFGQDSGGAILLREDDTPPPFPSSFPPVLRSIVERCLRLEPAQRYASVNELLAAMGQTARQGDSVRLPWLAGESAPLGPAAEARPAAPPSPRPTPTPAATSASSETPLPTRAELRTVGAELARGAVGVARGVWDGVRGEVDSPRPENSSGGVIDENADVLVIQELEDPDEPGLSTGPASPFAAQDAPWRVELRRQREGSHKGAAASPVPLMTVPVPPRASGGLVGNVVQSFVVGAEILGALVTGPVLAFARGTVQSFDRVVRGVPSVLGSGIRLVLFLLLMGLMGAVSAGVLLAALAFNP